MKHNKQGVGGLPTKSKPKDKMKCVHKMVCAIEHGWEIGNCNEKCKYLLTAEDKDVIPQGLGPCPHAAKMIINGKTVCVIDGEPCTGQRKACED